MNILLQLFLSFLQIGCFSFGGGYAAMPLIQEQVVSIHGWMDMDSFANLVTIAEMTPGPIAVNAATFVGTQLAGPVGAVVATLGCIFPSMIFVTALAYIYNRYRNMTLLQGTLGTLRPAVVSMIAAAGLSILTAAFFRDGMIRLLGTRLSLRMIIYFISAIFLLRKCRLNPILVMVLCGIAELLFTLISA